MTDPQKLEGDFWGDQSYGNDPDGNPITPHDPSEYPHNWLPQQANQARDAINDHAACIIELATAIESLDEVQTLTAAEIVALLNTVSDYNAVTDAQLSKLVGIESNATADMTASEIAALLNALNDWNTLTDAVLAKINGIETGATADLTGTEIATLLFAEANQNALSDSLLNKLNNIESNATADMTASEIAALIDTLSNRNVLTDALLVKINAIESGATADQTGSEIGALLDALTDRNPFTDAEKTKLAGLEDAAHKGQFSTLSALQTAHPTPSAGDTADVGDPVQRYIESSGSWVVGALPGGETSASVKTKYEANADTNALTDTLLSKLTGIEAGAEVNLTATEARAALIALGDTNFLTDALLLKLTNIESNATGDQTATEVAALLDGLTDRNPFTDALLTKLNGIETGATADMTGPEIAALLDALSNRNPLTDALLAKLNAIDDNATGEMTGAEIVAALFAESDQNPLTDALLAKINGIEANAKDDQTGVEIAALIGALDGVHLISDAEKQDIADEPITRAAADSGLQDQIDQLEVAAVGTGVVAQFGEVAGATDVLETLYAATDLTGHTSDANPATEHGFSLKPGNGPDPLISPKDENGWTHWDWAEKDQIVRGAALAQLALFGYLNDPGIMWLSESGELFQRTEQNNDVRETASPVSGGDSEEWNFIGSLVLPDQLDDIEQLISSESSTRELALSQLQVSIAEQRAIDIEAGIATSGIGKPLGDLYSGDTFPAANLNDWVYFAEDNDPYIEGQVWKCTLNGTPANTAGNWELDLARTKSAGVDNSIKFAQIAAQFGSLSQQMASISSSKLDKSAGAGIIWKANNQSDKVDFKLDLTVDVCVTVLLREGGNRLIDPKAPLSEAAADDRGSTNWVLEGHGSPMLYIPELGALGYYDELSRVVYDDIEYHAKPGGDYTQTPTLNVDDANWSIAPSHLIVAPIIIDTVANGETHAVVNYLPFATTLIQTVTKAAAGSCTVTTNALGTTNSATTSTVKANHTTGNAIAAGGSAQVTTSANSSCTELEVTLIFVVHK